MESQLRPISVIDALEQFELWLANHRDLSPHTVRAYATDVRALAKSIGGTRLVTDLEPATVVTFLEAQRRAGICGSSLRRRSIGIRNFCGFLMKHGYVEISPWPQTPPTFRRVRSLPRAVPASELALLVRHLVRQTEATDGDAANKHGASGEAATTLLAVVLLITTGLRVSELCACRVEDVNVENRTIQVLGKGRRERVVYLTSDWTTDLTSAYLATRAELQVTHEQLLFNVARRPLSPASVRVRLANAAKAAGIRRQVTPHALRHSAATQLIESGVDIRYVQRLLGHASLTTTEIYTHVTDQALRKAVTSADVLAAALDTR